MICRSSLRNIAIADKFQSIYATTIVLEFITCVHAKINNNSYLYANDNIQFSIISMTIIYYQV